MELAGEHISPLHGGMEDIRIFADRLYDVEILRLHVEGVDEIDENPVGDLLEELSVVQEENGIPADLRDLEALPVRESPAVPPEDPEARHIRTLLASLEQRLHADADPEERDLARDHLPDHVFQSVFPQISHRVAEISDARKHNMIRR